MSKIPKWIWILFLLFCMGLFPAFPYIFPKWYDLITDQYYTNVFINYEDSTYYGADVPIEGLNWTMYDGSNSILGTGKTASDGMVSVIILPNVDQSGEGIHLEFTYQANDPITQITNLEIGVTTELEMPLYTANINMKWQHDNSPIANLPYILYHDGTPIFSGTTDPIGVISNVNSMIASGDYIVEIDGIWNSTTFNVPIDYRYVAYSEDVFIIAENLFHLGNIISYHKKLGAFLFHVHKFTNEIYEGGLLS